MINMLKYVLLFGHGKSKCHSHRWGHLCSAVIGYWASSSLWNWGTGPTNVTCVACSTQAGETLAKHKWEKLSVTFWACSNVTCPCFNHKSPTFNNWKQWNRDQCSHHFLLINMNRMHRSELDQTTLQLVFFSPSPPINSSFQLPPLSLTLGASCRSQSLD